MTSGQTRTYQRATSVVFLKTNETFGGLSNMAGGFPLSVNGIEIRTSEALYQACRFPHLPDVQRLIIEQRSPMTAKMKSKPHRKNSRADWDQVRVRIMRWCLRVKLAQNWRTFSELLLETGDRPIVEQSSRDDFWGAKPTDDHTLVGMNVLGRLLMELREAVRTESRESLLRVQPLSISEFLLVRRPIRVVAAGGAELDGAMVQAPAQASGGHLNGPAVMQPSLFDDPMVKEPPSLAYPGSKEGGWRIADLKPYPECNEPRSPWLGYVPQHWDVLPLAGLARLKSVRNQSERQLLSVYLQRGVVRFSDVGEKRTNPTSEDLSKYQAVDPGDFVLNNQQAWRGSVGVSDHSGIVSPAYLVLALSDRYSTRYANLLLRDRSMVSQYLVCSKGVGTIQRNLYWPHLKRVSVVVPPPDEQAAIVRFLDWANGRLERAIRAKRKVIALLNEQKQAIIHRSVTRGLDPSVLLKPSGIPWLGEIPQHWEVRRAKYLYREVDERSTDGSEELLSVSHLTGVTPRSQKNITMFKAASYAGHKLCRPGDLVVNTMWAWMGALGVSTHTGIISPAYAVYRPRRPESIVGMYMEGLLRSRPYVSNIICRSTGLRASRLRLYPDEFFRLPIVQPPAEEQQRIVDTIQGETADLETAISRLEREIELLREYRTCLVADVVTGKLDVREAAARLPDEAPPDTAEDITDLGDEIDATDEEAVE